MKPLSALVAYVVIGFGLIMLVYVYTGRAVVNRFGYAAFMSVVPALIAALVFKWRRWKPSPGVVALVYFTLFILGVLIQSVLR